MEGEVSWGRMVWRGAHGLCTAFTSVAPIDKALNTEPLFLHQQKGDNSTKPVHLWNANYLKILDI